MGKRDQLHGIFIKTRDDWYNFKAARNEVKSALIRAHKDYVHNEVTKHKNNTGSVWKIFRDTVAYEERESVVYSGRPKIVAEEFNHFFSSVGKNSATAASQIMQDNIFFNIPPIITVSNPHYATNESEMFNSVSCSEV